MFFNVGISGKDSIEHKTDERFAKTLSQFLAGYRVGSFGDGPGSYKEIFENLKQVQLYDAFDGAPYSEEKTNGRVKFLDLSVPIYHLNTYDWIVSVEVAEHIPKEFEHIFLDNLVRHAEIGIVLSWSAGLCSVFIFNKFKLLIIQLYFFYLNNS